MKEQPIPQGAAAFALLRQLMAAAPTSVDVSPAPAVDDTTAIDEADSRNERERRERASSKPRRVWT